MLDPARAAGLDARIGFRLGGGDFVAHLADGRIGSSRGPPDGADLVVTGPPPVIAAAIYGGQPLAALEARARCGSRATARWPGAS